VRDLSGLLMLNPLNSFHIDVGHAVLQSEIYAVFATLIHLNSPYFKYDDKVRCGHSFLD
jgi:hypothetical protein